MTEAPFQEQVPKRSLLELHHVNRSYGRGAQEVSALTDVTFNVLAGEFVAIMGPSGSGKSTLLALAGGLDSPTSGDVLVNGIPLAGLDISQRARLRRDQIGYVFQDFNLIPTLTVLENVMLPLELGGMSLREAKRLASVALHDVGIEKIQASYTDQISGGQAQRVAIARAIVGDRVLILADEPTGALDTKTGDEVMRVLRTHADRGSAVVLVTHEARHASWADRVMFLRDGRLIDQTQLSTDPSVLLSRST